MAIKKSELYSTLWKSCDELRGGMDASQYKDYVLVMLFLKYISDKSKNDKYFSVEIPTGCTFEDMIALKGKDEIGEKVNKILEKLAETNPHLSGVITVADFSDESKLGKGDDLIKTVSNLIGIFQSSGLDFGKNRTEDDDLMGDAYEYLMKNFATESGKSKGQFYTPAEVSRVMAKVIGIQRAKDANETLYDPTCGSCSLLLKALSEAPIGITVYGQEKDVATHGLAKMNMILHGEDAADIKEGDTINNPRFFDGDNLKTFNYIVANPPFSTKSWLKSAKEEDIYGRWGSKIGIPPEKNGDYAFLLHIIRSLKRNGTGACILPHGVLFRGNGEYTIRKNVVKYIKGIIGLPPNLFFGTGIPACILILDKRDVDNRKGIFMIDAKNGYTKDGAKNRLREQDIRRIVDVWEEHKDVPHYARFVTLDKVAENDYNLNLPRYIPAADNEILQDIEAHLQGGLPLHDIEQMKLYWNSCPTLRNELFDENVPRITYATLKVDKSKIRNTIQQNKDYRIQSALFHRHFKDWKGEINPVLSSLCEGNKPKSLVKELGNSILCHFNKDALLVDAYDVYDVLMNYWNETMQDDCYLVSEDGWKATLYVPQPADKKTKSGEIKKAKRKEARTIADFACDLLPIEFVIKRYCNELYQTLLAAEEHLSEYESQKAEMEEEHKEEYLDEANFEGGKITDVSLKKREKLLKTTHGNKEELDVIVRYIDIRQEISATKSVIKVCNTELKDTVQKCYDTLTPAEIKEIVINDKWYGTLSKRLDEQMQQVGQQLTSSVIALVERYENTLPELNRNIENLKHKVTTHLKAMGFNWA
jgi:type I restriction enzyme M protein